MLARSVSIFHTNSQEHISGFSGGTVTADVNRDTIKISLSKKTLWSIANMYI